MASIKWRLLAAFLCFTGAGLLLRSGLIAQTNGPDTIEVQGRGPVHEAFATPFVDAKQSPLIARRPPAMIDELPPEVRPDANVVWISGYWAWDDDRNGFLWVSGCWRLKPNNLDWMPGYWHEEAAGWRWVAGFWIRASASGTRVLTYYPKPPAPLNMASPGNPGKGDVYFAPGGWEWTTGTFSWHGGQWQPIRADQVYVPAQYRWTPQGYIYQAAFWDAPLAKRGLLYAPVAIDEASAGPDFAYTPTYAVHDALILDSLFVRPGLSMYSFGDYYGNDYHIHGYEPAFYQSRRTFEPLVANQQWEHKEVPHWFDKQLSIVAARDGDRAARPPRTLAEQSAILQAMSAGQLQKPPHCQVPLIAPAQAILESRNIHVLAVDTATRIQIRDGAERILRKSSQLRAQVESARLPAGTMISPHSLEISMVTAPAPYAQKKFAPGQSTAIPGPALTAVNVETPQVHSPADRSTFSGHGAAPVSPTNVKQPSKGFIPETTPNLTTIPLAQFGPLPAIGDSGKALGGPGAPPPGPGTVGAVNK